MKAELISWHKQSEFCRTKREGAWNLHLARILDSLQCVVTGTGRTAETRLLLGITYIHERNCPKSKCRLYGTLCLLQALIYSYFPLCILYTCVCTHTQITHKHWCLPTFEIVNLSYRYVLFYVNTIKYLSGTYYLKDTLKKSYLNKSHDNERW